jgi:glycosyltransferase involved in cell wall biosynthesis
MSEISTIVITLNEERNIERCLKSVMPFSQEIVVVDSGSTDRTVEACREFATTVISHEWLGYGRQKRFALSNAKCPWVFSIDADEEVSTELCDEIQSLDFASDGYKMPRRVRYLNRWIKHGGWYPGYVLRLFDRNKGRFTDEIIHESVELEGTVGRLRNDLYHYSYRDVAHHIEKMNEFTTLAAQKMFAQNRRAQLHNIAVYPFFEFFKHFIVKRGFLDGLAGLTISSLHFYYVFLKYAKLYELRPNRRRAGRD